jgi:hypothetical protein
MSFPTFVDDSFIKTVQSFLQTRAKWWQTFEKKIKIKISLIFSNLKEKNPDIYDKIFQFLKKDLLQWRKYKILEKKLYHIWYEKRAHLPKDVLS